MTVVRMEDILNTNTTLDPRPHGRKRVTKAQLRE